MTKLFELGQVIGTPAAIKARTLCRDDPQVYLDRHLAGDWGDIPSDHCKANDSSVKNQSGIFSIYLLKDNVTKIWIMTEGDRSVTNILLPVDY